MRVLKSNHFILLSGTITCLSIIALLLNHFKFHYIGNNYFPEGSSFIAVIILINYIGLCLFFGKEHRLSKSGLELIIFFVVMSLIALATNAVQLTPFPTIDKRLIQFEGYFGVNLVAIMEWANQFTYFKFILALAYDSLTYQMSFIPLCVIAAGRFTLLKDYYLLLLMTTLLGFIIYYFFPTTAPASEMQSNLFLREQLDTGLKFFQIHQHIPPTTNEGGLIAFPSFHTIWAILCVYLVKDWPIACVFLGVVNLLLVIACVLLGWHYPIDIVAGIVLVLISYFWLQWIKR